MGLFTHLVVSYDHESGVVSFDGDGSREWIRRLFDPMTNTWSDEDSDFVAVPEVLEAEAVQALASLGVVVSDNDWMVR